MEHGVIDESLGHEVGGVDPTAVPLSKFNYQAYQEGKGGSAQCPV